MPKKQPEQEEPQEEEQVETLQPGFVALKESLNPGTYARLVDLRAKLKESIDTNMPSKEELKALRKELISKRMDEAMTAISARERASGDYQFSLGHSVAVGVNRQIDQEAAQKFNQATDTAYSMIADDYDKLVADSTAGLAENDPKKLYIADAISEVLKSHDVTWYGEKDENGHPKKNGLINILEPQKEEKTEEESTDEAQDQDKKQAGVDVEVDQQNAPNIRQSIALWAHNVRERYNHLPKSEKRGLKVTGFMVGSLAVLSSGLAAGSIGAAGATMGSAYKFIGGTVGAVAAIKSGKGILRKVGRSLERNRGKLDSFAAAKNAAQNKVENDNSEVEEELASVGWREQILNTPANMAYAKNHPEDFAHFDNPDARGKDETEEEWQARLSKTPYKDLFAVRHPELQGFDKPVDITRPLGNNNPDLPKQDETEEEWRARLAKIPYQDLYAIKHPEEFVEPEDKKERFKILKRASHKLGNAAVFTASKGASLITEYNIKPMLEMQNQAGRYTRNKAQKTAAKLANRWERRNK